MAIKFQKEPMNAHSSIKHVIGVVSGKGGVGKSFVTASMAAAMRKKGYEVGIMDGLVRSGFWHSLKQTLIFTYDNSRLSSYDCGYGYSGDISWDNNSISQSNNSEFIYSGKTCKGYNPYIVDYVDSNPFYNLAIAQPKLFGLHVNQLPEKIKGNDEVSLSYKLDKEGYLVKVTATYHNAYEDDETEIYEYTWK